MFEDFSEPRNFNVRNNKNNSNGLTINELLSAISENEYPDYILEAINRVKEWLNDAINSSESDDYDPVTAIFEHDYEYEDDSENIENLFSRLGGLEEFADVLPNIKAPEGKPDTIVINIAPPDYEGGLRAAIDYAAVFNRPNCRRIWIISNSFIFDEVIRFSPHVDALSKQGITLRFILVTPWGWVELPLSRATASKQQLVWRSSNEEFNDKAKKRRGKSNSKRNHE